MSDDTKRAFFASSTREDYREAWLLASESADRFRDVICQALGLHVNPGDDELVKRLLRAHGKGDEPESHRWRDFLDGAIDKVAAAGHFGEPHGDNVVRNAVDQFKLADPDE